MPAKFRSVNVGQIVWLAIEVNNRLTFLHPMGWVGDLIRPGQTMRLK